MNEMDGRPTGGPRADGNGNIYMGKSRQPGQQIAPDGRQNGASGAPYGNMGTPPRGEAPVRPVPGVRPGEDVRFGSFPPQGRPYAPADGANGGQPRPDADGAAAQTIDPKDRKQIVILGVLDIAVFLFIVVYLVLQATGVISGVVGGEESDPASEFYDVSTVFDELTPHFQASVYPEGMDPALMALYSENNDVVGWLRIPGTGIDNVVLQGEDNNTYLRADFYHNYNKRTRLYFADFRNTFTTTAQNFSKVSIIYGHHLTTDTRIFAELENYANVEYYRKHPVVELNTLYGKTTWKVFGMFFETVESEDDPVFYYWNPSITDAETIPFCNEVLTRSMFVNPAVDLLPTDKILCLSTCTYIIKNNYDNRCVLMARLVRDGESAEVDVSAAQANPNRRMPHAWYVQQGLSDPYQNAPVFTAGANG